MQGSQGMKIVSCTTTLHLRMIHHMQTNQNQSVTQNFHTHTYNKYIYKYVIILCTDPGSEKSASI